MSTRSDPGVDAIALGGPDASTDPGDWAAFASEIGRLANAFLHGGSAEELAAGLPAGSPVSTAPVVPFAGNELHAFAPPNLGPNALSVGAGGVSPNAWPHHAPGPGPLPAVLHGVPASAVPLPKDTDLRAIPATLSGAFGGPPLLPVSAPVAESEPAVPYFLALAGFGGGAPSVPAAIPDAGTLELPAYRPELVASTPGIFDPYAVKRDFPILAEHVHGKPLVWLDNAATTQKPNAVIERLSYFYRHENSNIHRAAHALAARATDAYEAARTKVARFINAPSDREIVFVRGTTEAINLVAQSWGRRNVGPDDEIVITWLEHHANIVPWQQLASATGARLRVVPVDSRGQVVLEDYERLLGPRTKLVSISHVSNALGTIVPVQEMTAIAHRYGARVLVDGAQSVSHMPVDVQAIDSDFFVFSGHKVFAPTGIGALYGKRDVLEAMPPWQGGGNMIVDVTFERTQFHGPPARFEAGTGNIADAVGLGAALDYVSGLGLANVSRYEHELLEYATGRLAEVPGLKMIGTAPDKAGVLSFIVDGLRTEDIGRALDQEGIAVRAGHHCAQPILRRFGVESTVRASLAPYNTCEDIDALVGALLRLTGGGRMA